MKHHTKDKGDKGTAQVIADLLLRGISICLPLSEHLPFDLVGVRDNGDLIRISVKYRTATKGIVSVPFRSSYSDSKGVHTKEVNKDFIDIVAIYCPDTNKVYYCNPKEFGKVITLRIAPSKNNQTKGVLFADNYLVL
jgi:hypothetical protein